MTYMPKTKRPASLLGLAAPSLLLTAAMGLSACGSDTSPANTTGDTDGDDAADGDLAPEFIGPTKLEVLGETDLRVSWPSAEDDLTPADQLTYNIYVAESLDALDYSSPRASTGPGIEQAMLTGLTPGKKVYVVVRAVDESAQESDNTEAYSISTQDNTPPTFGGIDSLTPLSGTELEATWGDATDSGTQSGDMVYEIYVSESSGGQDFDAPTLTTGPGETTATIGGLNEYTEYFVVVRPVDESGNANVNFVERSARTLDATPPTFTGAKSATASGSAIQIAWDPASDNVTETLDIKYNIYANVDNTPGLVMPTATTVPGASSYSLTSLPLNTNYKIIVRAEDEFGNEDENTVEVSATTGATEDETPPTFNGIVLLQATGPTSLYAAWDPATDDFTAQGNIVYDLYVSTATGTQNFMTPTFTTAPGVTNADLINLLPDTEYWVVVRARDISGNSDPNTVEAAEFTEPDNEAPQFAGVDAVSAPSATEIQVSWNAGTDNVTAPANLRYHVYAGPDVGSVDYNNALTVITGGTDWTLTGLEPQTQRCFSVRAEDEYTNLDQNTVVLCTSSLADTTAPTFGGISTVTQLDPLRAEVTWPSASDDVDPHAEIEFLVFWSTGSINYGSPAAVSTPGANSLVLDGLPPDTKLNFAVRARDEAGNVDGNTKTINDTTIADTTAPKFTGAKSISATSTSVEVTWDEASDYVTPHSKMTYEVCGGICTLADCVVGNQLPRNCDWYDGIGSSKSFSPSTVDVVGGLTFPNTGLNPNDSYFYQVRAIDEAGNRSGWGPWVSATTLSDVTAPTFAGISSATVQSATEIDLTWAAATDPETAQGNIVYDVYWNTSNSFNFNSPSFTTAGGATSYTISGLNPATTYYMVVKARDQAGNRSTNTTATSRSTQADTTPPDPTTVTLASGGQCDVINVYWSATTDDATAHAQMDYQICASTSSIGCTTNFNGNIRKTVTGLTNTSITVGAGDDTWYVRVRARDQSNNVGSSANQTTASVYDSIDPYWPGGSTMSANYANQSTNVDGVINLSWSQAKDACVPDAQISYQICRSTSISGCNSWTTYATTSAESFQFSNLSTDTYYYFRVRPLDNEGNTSTSYEASGARTHTSYARDVYPEIFNASSASGGCAGCHSWTRGNTDNVTATCNTSYKYVNDYSSNLSVIYRQMTSSQLCPTKGQMPAGGPYISARQNTMERWIDQGAHNN